MSVLTVEAANVAPLGLSLSRHDVGGVTGLSPTVRVRDMLTPGSYLDWNDNTFKTSGWTTLNATMTDVGGGHYQRDLDLSAVNAVDGNVYSAEYVASYLGSSGADADTVFVVEQATDLALMRKMMENRLEESPGNPGVLVLYDDDGTTPLRTWQLRDYTGGATLPSVGAPSRRSAAT